jgi:SAM-dependent methyltransferase
MVPQPSHADTQISLAARQYPEIAAGGFSRVDWSVAFWSQVRALARPEHRVLDFGAGRGEHVLDDPVSYRRALATLKGHVAHVAGCDVSPAVLGNPLLDEAHLLEAGGSLPFADASFDLIVSRMVFEHLEDPGPVAAELVRVTRPGGWICAVTPNRWGYVALASQLVPNRLHARVLAGVQPGRKEEDVFPTHYRLNSRGAFRRHFGASCDVHMFRTSGEPAYHFGSPLIFSLFNLAHRLLPEALQTAICAFMRKREQTRGTP